MESADSVSAVTASAGRDLHWRRSRHWVTPPPSAWLPRALTAGLPSVTGTVAQLECDLQSPRLAHVRDWRVLGHATLPFGVCAAVVVAAAAVLSDGGSGKAPARFSLGDCTMPAHAQLPLRGAIVQLNAAPRGELQLDLLVKASAHSGVVFACTAARLRRSTSATRPQRPSSFASLTLERIAACRTGAPSTALRATSSTIGNRQHQPSNGLAASLSAVLAAFSLTASASAEARLTVAAAACMVTELDERDGLGSQSAAVSTLPGSSSLAAHDSAGVLVVCAGVETLPLSLALHAHNQEQWRVQDSRLRYDLQWQADSPAAQSTRAGTENTLGCLKLMLAAPRRRGSAADSLSVTTRMLAVLQASAPLGTVCDDELSGEELSCRMGLQLATHAGVAQSALRGLLKAAAAEAAGSACVSTRRSTNHDYRHHVVAAIELQPQSADSQASAAHPLGSPVQHGHVFHFPLLLPTCGSVRHTGEHTAVPATPQVAADGRRIGTAVILGGLGGLGRQVAAWLSAQGAAHVVLASRSGRCGTRELRRLCCGGGALTIARCDVAAQADADWLAADAVAGPIHVRF